MTTRRRARPDEHTLARRRRLAGVVYLLVPALLVWLSVAVYNKDFTDTATVVVETGAVGSEMHPHAEVKMRGVVIGEVAAIDTDGATARLELALEPGELRRVPSDVTAQMLPTTLFGQRFVALVPPPDPSPEPIAAGAVIPQDRSANAIELQDSLDSLLPLLTAVKPQKLSATLTAIAQALQGRGTELGETMVRLDGYLKKLNPQLPVLNRDIKEFVKVGRTYSEAAPDILDALDDATTTSSTLAERKDGLSTLYASVTSTSQDLTTWLRRNERNLIRLAATGRPTLELLGRYAPSFPCTLNTLAEFVPAMDRALGKGTGKPGLHVDVQVSRSRGAYLPGRDDPEYGAGGGPRCYPVPYVPGRSTPAAPTGSTGSSGSTGPTGSTGSSAAEGARALTGLEGGLGVANSPQENTLVNELLAAEGTQRPDELPDWSSVFAGPAFRGAEVSLG